MKKRYFVYGILLLVITCVFASVFSLNMKNKTKVPGKRILACISSFNRPIFVSGQVLRLLNQSYPVDISVSVKGVPEDYVRKTLLKEWEPAIKQGRVIVRFDENRGQYSNLMDTVRDIDLDKYDYFCKVDDDDWYGPDYFKHVNEWLQKGDEFTLSYTQNNYIILPWKETIIIPNNTELFGPAMCFSRNLIKLALELEKDPKKAETYIPGARFSYFQNNKEDAYLHRLAEYTGKVQKRETPIEDLSFGWQYPSVMRKIQKQ